MTPRDMFATFERLATIRSYDVCVVGAGPVGLAVALHCEAAGLAVLLLESGEANPDAFAASLSAGHRVDPARHAEPDVAICRSLGGTSRWWGGRCVPFDDIDFEERVQAPGTKWPFGPHEVSRFYPAAAEFLGIGSDSFERAPALTPPLEDATLAKLERWTPKIDMGVRHRRHIESSDRLTAVLGATVVNFMLSGDQRQITGLTVAAKDRRLTIPAHDIVLACGGLETPRLLLAVQRRWPEAFGGVDGPLGRGYMGHPSGKIADIVLNDPNSVADHDFFLDDGVYVRRRLQLTAHAQRREGLLNAAFWIDNPPFHAVSHSNGTLSSVWLALAIPVVGRRLVSEGVRLAHVGPKPWRWARHLWNVARTPMPTLSSIIAILHARLIARPRKPGFLIRNRAGRYALHFHSEHARDCQSRVTLIERADALGLPFLDVRLHFSQREADSVVRSHEVLDESLRRAGVGRLEYRHASRGDRADSVLAQAVDGFHQVGTVRMDPSPVAGVVDSDCRVHGIENLWVAGSAVLPSSGQANPTFVAVALAIRLARHLAVRKTAAALAAQ